MELHLLADVIRQIPKIFLIRFRHHYAVDAGAARGDTSSSTGGAPVWAWADLAGCVSDVAPACGGTGRSGMTAAVVVLLSL